MCVELLKYFFRSRCVLMDYVGLNLAFRLLTYIKPHSHPTDFYWDHQGSWTPTSATTIQISIIQSYDRNGLLTFCHSVETSGCT